jgi:hypothetical protein
MKTPIGALRNTLPASKNHHPLYINSNDFRTQGCKIKDIKQPRAGQLQTLFENEVGVN